MLRDPRGAAIVAALVLLAAAPKAEVPPTDLSGSFKLNSELSEDPAKKLREAFAGARGRAGGPGGPGMQGPGRGGRGAGRPGMGGRGGPPPQPAESSGGESVFGPPLDGTPAEVSGQAEGPRRRGPVPSASFEIAKDGDALSLRSEHGLRILRPDGRSWNLQDALGQPIVVESRWREGHLEVKTKRERGGALFERYTLRPDGRLQVDVELSGTGPMAVVQFRLVYDGPNVAQSAAPNPNPLP